MNTLLAILMSLSLVTHVVAPRTVCTTCLLAESISPGSSCCSTADRSVGMKTVPLKATDSNSQADCCKPNCCEQESTPVDQASFCSTSDTPCVCSHIPAVPAFVAAPAIVTPVPEQFTELPAGFQSTGSLLPGIVTDSVQDRAVNRTKPHTVRPLFLLDCRFII
ncbi:hypothetical protein [Rubinisphaera margarita]|uniref:hypothetical protein n=1 Tax=Rubinisphaera margarita TaxID=2909586 RepID=UPI001EE88F40|nr:hypothetical protein [Rubinisphaera margarita]MCG6156029.1 hypothetical protein [Rubinisphaera margarita]